MKNKTGDWSLPSLDELQTTVFGSELKKEEEMIKMRLAWPIITLTTLPGIVEKIVQGRMVRHLGVAQDRVRWRRMISYGDP